MAHKRKADEDAAAEDPAPYDWTQSRALRVRSLLEQLQWHDMPFVMRFNQTLRDFHIRASGLMTEIIGPLEQGSVRDWYYVHVYQADSSAHVQVDPAEHDGVRERWPVCNSATFVHNAQLLRRRVHAAHAAHALLAPPELRDPRYPRRSLPRDLVVHVLSFLSPSPRALALLSVLY